MPKDIRSLLPADLLPVSAEFVSTGFLVLLGCISCSPFPGLGPPSLMQVALAFGLVVMFNIQVFGHVSGAHMNPSVTLAAVVLRRIPPLLGTCYILAQCAGAIAGYGLLLILLPRADKDAFANLCVTNLHSTVSPLQGVVVEVALTAILILVTCSFWDPVNKTNVDSLSIKFGLTITGLSLAGGYYTGASMNPARSLGPALWNNAWEHHWIYWVGPLVSAIISALYYKLLLHSPPALPAADAAEELPLNVQEKPSDGVA